jgi:hypothetical protein
VRFLAPLHWNSEFGAVSFSIEGKVSIQNVGQISVSGMTIEAATQKKGDLQ